MRSPLRLFSIGLTLAFAWIPAAAAPAQKPAFPPATPESQGVDASALEALAAAVQGYLDQDKIVGAELLVLKNRRTVLHRAFGWRDRQSETPMEPDTIFNVRSMTKPLTGAALQILVDEGKLALDDPVSEYLPGFANDESRDITVLQVLTHRSGLPLTVFSTDLEQYENLQAVAAAAGEGGPEFEPDSKFWYSDAGSDVVAALVEKISGKPVDEFVSERLLEPLGMEDSFYVDDPDGPRWQRVASLYVGKAGAWSRFWTPEDGPLYPFAWGSQTLYSTPSDYARFLALWMDGGVVDGERVLSEAAMQRILTPVSRMSVLGSDMRMPSGFPDLERWYGQMSVLQLERENAPEGAPVIIGHSGSDGTIAWGWPARDLMILYFTQSRGGTTVLGLETVIDRLLLHPEAHQLDETTRARFEPYLGTYVANFGPFRNDEFTVLIQGKSLALDIPNQLAFELSEPDEEGKWRFVLDESIAIAFDRNEAGEVTGLKLFQAGQAFELPKGKAPPKRALDPAEVQKYLGFYWDDDTDTKIEFVLDEGSLAAKRPDVPIPIPFDVPDEEGIWVCRLNPSIRIRFNEDPKGNVVSFTAYGPDGEAVRKRLTEEAGDEPRRGRE